MTRDEHEESADVRIERLGDVGRIILDRPRALNAITLDMVERIRPALEEWRTAGLRAVTIESASDRAFCAGGDIRRIRENSLAGEHDASLRFFETEYAVNALLGGYPVPVLALVDGVCMGGGMGLSVHGTFVVVSPQASFAMPETKIGFFPDVGGSHFLPRLPGETGRYLGLTGARIGAADALALGLATHACSSADLARLPELIAAYDGPLEQLLRELAPDQPGEPGTLAGVRPELDWAFSAPDLDGITVRLRRLVDEAGHAARWAQDTLAALAAASPHSLAVTDHLIVEGRQLDLAACLAMELATAAEMIRTADFIEGVRAVLVDKDHTPTWTT